MIRRRKSVLFNIIPCSMFNLPASSLATFSKASRILSKAHPVALISTLKMLLYSTQSPPFHHFGCAVCVRTTFHLSGSWGKSERKEFCQVRSRLMGQRSGFVNSARSQMCGRGGVASDATTTSRQGCVGSTGRRSQQRMVKGQGALRHRVEKRTRKTLRLRSFGPN